MTEECAASSTYQHVSPSSGECSPPTPPLRPPDVFLRSLSAELLCDCSSLRLSALVPVFSSAALVTTSYGLQTHSSSRLHSEKSEGQHVMTGSGLIGLIKQWSLIKTHVFSPSPKLQALLQTGRVRSGPHWKVVTGSNSETQYPECIGNIMCRLLDAGWSDSWLSRHIPRLEVKKKKNPQ